MNVRENWNKACPKCGRDDQIEVVAHVMLRLKRDGTDADEASDRSHEWDDDSKARCDACGYEGVINNFELHPHPFAPEELNTILAALRLWQAMVEGRIDYFSTGNGEAPRYDELQAIAGDSGETLAAEEIDDLCERLNQ